MNRATSLALVGCRRGVLPVERVRMRGPRDGVNGVVHQWNHAIVEKAVAGRLSQTVENP